MTAVLSPQQSTTWEIQGFPLPVPPQARSSSAPTASLMGSFTNLDERASGIIKFPPQPVPRPSHQPALTLRLWGHLVYYYRHHNSHSWHQNMPKRYFHVIMYNDMELSFRHIMMPRMTIMMSIIIN